jgi:ureidoglycolate lyase
LKNPEDFEIQPLTASAFAIFGDVIEANSADAFLINDGRAQRFHDLAKIEVSANDGHPLISIVRSEPSRFPLTLRKVERHPLGSQAFIPLGNIPFLIVVAPSTKEGLPGMPRAFLSNGDQGVNYKAGIWHHSLIALNVTTDFLVVDRGGVGNNCDEIELKQEIIIEHFDIHNVPP